MPSLYETTVNTGEVASSNFTTLYNASGLAVPNAGAGSIVGNLNVGGNLTVQGSSLLIGEVTLQSTLSLPNYQFPLPDGSTFQVLATDGNGNLYWSDVSAIPGADYNISATTATGGANLTLANTAGFSDSVKFAAGTNMSIVRTDANTITIATVADNIPDGTARGQVLYWDGTAWTANNVISSAVSTDRLRLVYENSDPGVNSAVFLRKDYKATPYTTNDGVGVGFQLDSDSQVTNQIALISSAWNATTPSITLSTNINNNTAGPFVSVGNFTSAMATLSGDLTVTGGDIIAPAGGIANLYNSTAIGTINIGNSVVTEVNIGNIGSGRVFAKTPSFETASNAIIGNDLTVNGGDITAPALIGIANLYNSTALDTINIGNSVVTAVNIGNLASGKVFAKTALFETNSNAIIGNNLNVNGDTIKLNATGAAADNFIYFNGTNESLKWNQADTRFEFSDQLYISQTDIPAVLERRSLSTDLSPYEQKSGVKLVNRVTDAANNDTVITGPCVLFARTSGATDTTERRFATMGSNWNGATQTANLSFNWSSDNFAEPTPGNFPNTYTLLNLDSNNAKFQNNSIYIDYTTAGAGKVGINKAASATYTLDVNGTTNSIGNLTVQAENITINDDKTDADVNLNFGRLGAVNATIRWNATSDSFEWSSGDGVWHDFIDATLTAPFYNGQMLTYRIDSAGAGEWINDNRVTTTDSNERNVFEYRPLSPSAGVNTSLFLRKNYSNSVEGTPGAGTYADGAGVSLSFQVNSDTQPTVSYANITGVYSATVPTVSLRTSIDNGTTTPSVGNFTTAGATLPNDLAVNGNDLTTTQTTFNLLNATATTINAFGASTATNIGSTASGTTTIGWDAVVNKDLAVNGGDITTTQTTGNLFNATATTVNIGNGATNQVNIGSSSGTVNIKSPSLIQNDLGGASTTFNLLNTITTDLNIGGAATTVDIGSTASGTTTIGYDLFVNNDVNADSYIVDNLSTYNTQTTTTSLAGTPVPISATIRVSQKSVIKIIDNVTGEVHMLEALAFRSGTAGFLTTYAEMYSSVALATFTVTGTGGVTSILANPISSNSTTFTVARISLD